ncbi:MAG: TorF family putative porin [Methylophaga sp.]|nr:TorF family putative porin [Methylophaga sp.]
MKLKTLSALCLAASTLAMTSTAMAWESEDGQHSTSASVALSSEYVWRGISQSDEDPAISGSLDYAHTSGFYAGTWASNVDFGSESDTSLEIDVYAGFSREFGETGLSYDIGVMRYLFPGEGELDFNEVYGSLSYSIFTAGIAHSSDAQGSGEDGTYYSLGAGYDLPFELALAAGLGYYDLDKDEFGESGYQDYYIGVSKDLAGFTFDVTYTDTNSDAEDIFGEELSDDRFIFSVSSSF